MLSNIPIQSIASWRQLVAAFDFITVNCSTISGAIAGAASRLMCYLDTLGKAVTPTAKQEGAHRAGRSNYSPWRASSADWSCNDLNEPGRAY